MKFEKLLHKVRMKISPSYRVARRKATKQLLVDLRISRDLITERMEEALEKQKTLLRSAIKHGRLTPEKIRFYEIKLMLRQERITAIRNGKKSSDFDVQSFLKTMMMTSDISTMKGEYGESSTDPEEGCSG